MGDTRRVFAFEACVGRGGFGEVYRARMTTAGGLPLRVAVKVLHAGSEHPSTVARLQDEAALLAALEHPVILGVRDITRIEGRVALVTDYVDGEDLTACTRGPHPLPLRAAVEVVGRVADALASAWSTPTPRGPLRLVHRDIKPSNLRLSCHGEVTLLDFGIARSDRVTRNAHTASGDVVGTLRYLAPERFDAGNPDPASDVFALGGCLYEWVTCRSFYPAGPPPVVARIAFDRERFEAHLATQLAAIPAGVPVGIRTLLAGMLDPDPGQRPTSATVALQCEAMVHDLPGPNLRAWARARRWPAPANVSGPLTGRVIPDGDSEQDIVVASPRDTPGVGPAMHNEPVPTVPALRSAAPRSPQAWWLPIVTMSGLAGLAAVALVAMFVASRVSGAPSPVPAERLVDEAAPPTPRPDPVTADVTTNTTAATPRETQRPMAPANAPLPRSRPSPVVAPEEPPSAPETLDDALPPDPVWGELPPPVTDVQADEDLEYGHVNASSAIELRQGDAVFEPGKLPAGRYTIHTDFGGGLTEAGQLHLAAGATVHVACNTWLYTCGVQ